MVLITGGSFQGKRKFAEQTFPGKEIVEHFELHIRECLKERKDPKMFTAHYIIRHADAVFLMDEIGCGLVPMEKEERIWREEAGRAGCLLARQAEEVYRVTAGIGMRIK